MIREINSWISLILLECSNMICFHMLHNEGTILGRNGHVAWLLRWADLFGKNSAGVLGGHHDENGRFAESHGRSQCQDRDPLIDATGSWAYLVYKADESRGVSERLITCEIDVAPGRSISEPTT